ncbi:hypothetical protein DY467_24615 [Rhodopseudomonas sp. BR0G17]|nr:hypothetical protein [Rhodopseudomonas sp. BR0G17]
MQLDGPIHQTTNISTRSDEKIGFCMKHSIKWSRSHIFSPDQFRVLDSHLIAQSCSQIPIGVAVTWRMRVDAEVYVAFDPCDRNGPFIHRPDKSTK